MKLSRGAVPPATWGVLGIAAVLLLLTLAVYAPMRHHEFVGYDDPLYVTKNAQVQSGFTLGGVVWALTATDAGNWHPLTWLSHMLDCEILGLDAGAHHLSSLAFHAANALLLFFLLLKLTGDRWPSAFVALVFALHPLHVESVAWISERKDLLSTLLWLLTLWSYANYAREPGRRRYVFCLLLFALGLMAKPMLVTLPLVLLLIDFWPLGRAPAEPGEVPRHLLLEKLPFAVLAAASALITFGVQRAAGAVRSLDRVPFSERASNALVSYGTYVEKTLWPTGLAIPYPRWEIPLWRAAASGALLALVTFATIRLRRRLPYLTAGWLWFVITLIPVIGLVQVGSQSRADRYTYVPMIGLLVMIAWGVRHFLPRGTAGKIVAAAAGSLVLLACAAGTSAQLAHWRDTETLFRHAIEVTSDNAVAHYNLGLFLSKQGKPEEAVRHYEEAVRIRPNDVDARWNLGNTLFRQGRTEQAAIQFREVLRRQPDAVEPMTKLASILALGRSTEAIRLAERAAELTGGRDPMVLHVLALAYGETGEYDRAVEIGQRAASLAASLGQNELRLEIEARVRAYASRR